MCFGGAYGGRGPDHIVVRLRHVSVKDEAGFHPFHSSSVEKGSGGCLSARARTHTGMVSELVGRCPGDHSHQVPPRHEIAGVGRGGKGDDVPPWKLCSAPPCQLFIFRCRKCPDGLGFLLYIYMAVHGFIGLLIFSYRRPHENLPVEVPV